MEYFWSLLLNPYFKRKLRANSPVDWMRALPK